MGGGPDHEHMLIVLFGPEPKAIITKIKERFPYIDVTYFQVQSTRANNLPEAVKGVPIELWKSATIIVTLSQLPPSPADCPNVKFIHFFSAGVDAWADHWIIKDSQITLTTSSGIHGPPIAEWVLMTTLVASKHYALMYESQKEHRYGSQDKHIRETEDWVGKRIGIAGYGSIGRQVARTFHALGATILAYTASPRPTPSSRADQGYHVPGTGDPSGTLPLAWYSGTSKSDLHAFLAQDLDVLVMSLPLTLATTHLLGAEEFAILSRQNTTNTDDPPSSSSSTNDPPNSSSKKGGAFLVNISRGPILHQPALVHALNTSQLSGAALDVTDPEPLPPHDPLWDAKNVIITPHISGLSVRYAERAFDVLLTNLARRERGEEMFNVVQRGRGY